MQEVSRIDKSLLFGISHTFRIVGDIKNKYLYYFAWNL